MEGTSDVPSQVPKAADEEQTQQTRSSQGKFASQSIVDDGKNAAQIHTGNAKTSNESKTNETVCGRKRPSNAGQLSTVFENERDVKAPKVESKAPPTPEAPTNSKPPHIKKLETQLSQLQEKYMYHIDRAKDASRELEKLKSGFLTRVGNAQHQTQNQKFGTLPIPSGNRTFLPPAASLTYAGSNDPQGVLSQNPKLPAEVLLETWYRSTSGGAVTTTGRFAPLTSVSQQRPVERFPEHAVQEQTGINEAILALTSRINTSAQSLQQSGSLSTDQILALHSVLSQALNLHVQAVMKGHSSPARTPDVLTKLESVALLLERMQNGVESSQHQAMNAFLSGSGNGEREPSVSNLGAFQQQQVAVTDNAGASNGKQNQDKPPPQQQQQQKQNEEKEMTAKSPE